VTSYAVSYFAVDANTITGTVVNYQIGDSGTVAPTGTWAVAFPTPVQGKYLWTRTVTSFSKTAAVTSYAVSYYGPVMEFTIDDATGHLVLTLT
jgi:hypothetical protein